MSDALVVFLGPSLPPARARAQVKARFLPPARQGDVWRALRWSPRAIALIDGVFEAQPSVWHRELLDAVDAGVAVFGAASMGALRAAELDRAGVVGVGQIYRWAREGVLEDDAEVALLHADEEHGYRPLTLPLVNVRHAAALARAAKVLSPRRARELVGAAQEIFYQQRHWPEVLARVAWPASALARWNAFAARGLEDLKAKDALECLQQAAAFAASGATAPRSARQSPSALARSRKLGDAADAHVLDELRRRPDAGALAEAGLRRLLLAGWARSLGLRVAEAERREAERRWLRGLGVRARERSTFLAASGLDEAEVTRLTRDAALEATMLAHAQRVLPDGPGWLEGLASEARWRGMWARQAAGRASRRRGPKR